MGMSRLEASRGCPKHREARIARSVEGMEGFFSGCRRASELIAELRSIRERLRKIEAQVLSGWQELWRRINALASQQLSLNEEQAVKSSFRLGGRCVYVTYEVR